LITFDRTTKNLISAFRTDIAGLFIPNPFFSAKLFPVWDRSQYYFFDNRHGEIFDMLAGKVITLMASGVTLVCCALSYVALLAMHKRVIRQASVASDVSGGKIFTVRKKAFAGNFSFIQAHQSFLEFFIIITVGNIDGTDAAIKTTGGN
jgi:hypothetical protein